jgi:WD40 repeat protein
VRVWDRQHPEAGAQTRLALKGSVTGLGVSSDARWVATGRDNGIARVWDRSGTDPEELASWGYEDVITSIAMSNDGGLIVTGGDDGTVRVKRPEVGRGRCYGMHTREWSKTWR